MVLFNSFNVNHVLHLNLGELVAYKQKVQLRLI